MTRFFGLGAGTRSMLAVALTAVALLSTGASPATAVTAHRATLPGVTLLPPVGSWPLPTTALDTHVNLRIESFALAGAAAQGLPIGTIFSTQAPRPGQISIRRNGASSYYQAAWKTRKLHLPSGSAVRVEVRLATAHAGPACNAGVSLAAGCLAYFDVGLVGGRVRTVPPGLMRLRNHRTMHIKVHIAQGALVTPAPTALPGAPDSPAAAAIPNRDFEFNPNDYAPDPDLGGLTVSFDTLFLVFNLDTTVAEANDLLAQIGADIIGGRTGTAGEVSGILYIRVPTTSEAEMDTLITRLRANPIVQTAVQDAILEATQISKLPIDPNDPNQNLLPDDWIWEVSPDGGNWGLEAMRVPQMWNLNEALVKHGREANVGVLDVGFYDPHPDLVYDENITPSPNPGATGLDPYHGTHVAGTIAATYNNGLGTDGVDPYTHLVVDTYAQNVVAYGLMQFLEAMPDLDVVNVSLGYNWYKWGPFGYDIESLLDPRGREFVANQAAIFEHWEVLQERNHTLPLIVSAAGNESGTPGFSNDKFDARWESPWNYAGIADGIPNVLVVEAVGPASDVGYTRASFSNVNGDVSAPGVNIESTGNPADAVPYFLDSGTSMAAPHVTGLAGYLKSLDPTLTVAELKSLLTSNTNPVGGGASPMVDAFDAAMSIDSLRGDTSVLTRLLDVDDGTVDGNLREDCSTTCTPITTEDFDLDGGPGDGSVDMSDFRRWRDWLLEVENPSGLALDGNSTDLKKDLNGDDIVLGPDDENVYPRGDFNGDGILSRTATHYVKGHVNAIDTDLEVLQTLFNDPDVSASQLPALVDSGDIHVDTSGCMTSGISSVRTKIIDADADSWLDGRSDIAESHEYTEPVAANGTHYIVRLEAFDNNGNIARVGQKSFLLKLGGDAWAAPTCGSVTLTPQSLSVTLEAGDSTTPSVDLATDGVAVNWQFTNSLANVEPALTGGSLAAGDSVALDPTITCPAKAGPYGGFLNLEFTDHGGSVIKSGVPESLAVDIVCLTGGVEADPSPLTQTLSAWTSTQLEITLKNAGTALDYEAQAGDHVAIDDGANGELGKLGQAVIKVTVTCPLTPGTYTSSVALTFSRSDGKPVTVTHPDSVPVDLTCIGLLHLDGVDIENSINFESLDNAWEQYWSRDDEGTAEHNSRTSLNGTSTNLHEAIDPIGWGDQSSSLTLTRVVPVPQPPFEWMTPFQRPGTMSGSGSVAYTSSYDGTTAQWGAAFTFNYTTTRPPPNPDIGQEVCGTFSTTCSSLGATATTYFEVLPNTQESIVITWTCGKFGSSTIPVGTDGSYGRILLNQIGVNGITLFDSNTIDECSYEALLDPGKYGLTANMGLQSGASDSVGPASGSYTVSATYVPPDEP